MPPAGTRGGNCSDREKPLLAVLTQPSKTTARYPTFLFYIPETAVQEAQFVLKDADKKIVYKTKIQLPNKSGILRLSIPTDSTDPTDNNFDGLEIEKSYHWYFNIICDPTQRDKDDWIKGEIQRITLSHDLKDRLNQVDPHKRPNVYLDEGFLNDALVELDALRRAYHKDKDLKTIWEKLLRENGWQSIATEPIIQP